MGAARPKKPTFETNKGLSSVTRCRADNGRADPVIEAIFASLHYAWAHKNRRFERETWCRLIVRLRELPTV